MADQDIQNTENADGLNDAPDAQVDSTGGEATTGDAGLGGETALPEGDDASVADGDDATTPLPAGTDDDSAAADADDAGEAEDAEAQPS
jgi:hypothetical protein